MPEAWNRMITPEEYADVVVDMYRTSHLGHAIRALIVEAGLSTDQALLFTLLVACNTVADHMQRMTARADAAGPAQDMLQDMIQHYYDHLEDIFPDGDAPWKDGAE